MDSAYITRYNYKKLSGSLLQPDADISIDKIFSFIYEKSLSEILNHKEATRLYVQKQMLDEKIASLRIVKKVFNQNYVFSVSPPKFHKSANCEFLSSDFQNYLVPPAIKVLGEAKIKEFQEFCESKKKDFEGKADDVFWAHVELKFNVKISPEGVSYENSGSKNIDSMTIEQLQENINETINVSLDMISNNDFSKNILNNRFAPNMNDAISKISNEEAKSVVKQFFELKKTIINSLFELYKKQAKEKDYILPVDLLINCGLTPCKACWK